MDGSRTNRIVLALLVICSAILVTSVCGGAPGEIISWGSDSAGQISQTPTGTGFTTVAAGTYHSAALVPIAPAPAPVADFTANATYGFGTLAVHFIDLSTGSPTSWAWSFGDRSANLSGSTPADQNPVHVYTSPGFYTVTLTVTNGAGSDTETKTNYIIMLVCTQPPPPTADLSANRTSGPAPFAVQFTDTSTWSDPEPCIFGRWAWDFGDGTAITDVQNPVHTYTAAGTYAVNLTVTNSGGTESETKTAYITVTDPNIVQIPTSAAAPGDLDGDGRYEDVNGNGRKDFADVVLFFNQMSWIAANEPVSAFDYDGNGRIDFADVAWLFNNL